MGEGDLVGGGLCGDAVDAEHLAFSNDLNGQAVCRIGFFDGPGLVTTAFFDDVVSEFGCRATGLVELVDMMGLNQRDGVMVFFSELC